MSRPTRGRVEPGARALWWALALLVGLRAAAVFLPGMWLWGLNLLRFSPGWGWTLWGLSALALAPPLGRSALPFFQALGRALQRPAWALLFSAAGAVLVLGLPDQVRFVGDFLLRQGAVEEAVTPGRLYPQALPLDVLLHYTLPSWTAAHLYVPANLCSRLLGAFEVALLAVLAIAFARRLGLKGCELIAASAVIWWGGWLALYAGYSKAFTEMVLVLPALAWVGLGLMRSGRPALLFSLLLCGALLLHRSALALVPAASLAMILAAPREVGRRVALGRMAAAALPLVTLLVLAPRLVATLRTYDVGHFMSPGASLASQASEWLAPARLLDVGNLFLLFVPLAPLVLVLPFTGRSACLSLPERWFLGWLVAPYIGVAFVLRPVQGIPRDYDDFAAGGIGLALWLAVLLGETLRARPRAAWMTAAIVAGSVAPALLWLAHQGDLKLGLARVEAIAKGPPLRSRPEQAASWDYLGIRRFRAGRFAEAARDLARAAALAPSPRILLEWGLAAGSAGDWVAGERAYRLLSERAPAGDLQYQVPALVGLAGAAFQRGDLLSSRNLAERALRLSPRDEMAKELMRLIVEQESRRARLGTRAPSPSGPAP